MSDQITVPEFPAELDSNTRRAARAIKSTVKSALETMTEVAGIINRFRQGESAIVARLEASNTHEATEWKRAVSEAVQRDKDADAAYQAAIAPFAKIRDEAKTATAETVKRYFTEAVSAEQFGDDETPVSPTEYAEAVMDWTASVKQIRDAQRNSKNLLSLEWSLDIPSVGATRESGQSGQWRPRFSAASVNGKDLGESPILTDVVAEIPGMSRDLFIGCILKALPNSRREDWEAFDTGTVLPLTFTHNDKGYSVSLTKAAPITRKRADGTDEEVTEESDEETLARAAVTPDDVDELSDRAAGTE